MIDRDMFGVRSMQIALAALALSVGFAGWSLNRAVRLDPVPVGAAQKFTTSDALVPPDTSTPPDVVTVVSMNVFGPTRTAPTRRYRLAGYAEASAAPEAPRPTVVGTVVSSSDGTFAMLKIGNAPARVVRVGEVIGGYVVKSIERNVVGFLSPTGERITVSANK